MENPQRHAQVHPKIRDLIDYTAVRCAVAVARISAYKMSLAEIGALRQVISTAIKTAFYRGLIAQEEKRENYFEPWNPDNEPTDRYIRKSPGAKPVRERLWDAIKRRAASRYASKRNRSGS